MRGAGGEGGNPGENANQSGLIDRRSVSEFAVGVGAAGPDGAIGFEKVAAKANGKDGGYSGEHLDGGASSVGCAVAELAIGV